MQQKVRLRVHGTGLLPMGTKTVCRSLGDSSKTLCEDQGTNPKSNELLINSSCALQGHQRQNSLWYRRNTP